MESHQKSLDLLKMTCSFCPWVNPPKVGESRNRLRPRDYASLGTAVFSSTLASHLMTRPGATRRNVVDSFMWGHLGVSRQGYSNSWMVYFMEKTNLYKLDDLGVPQQIIHFRLGFTF